MIFPVWSGVRRALGELALLVSSHLLFPTGLGVMLQEQGGVNEVLACERGPPGRGNRPW